MLTKEQIKDWFKDHTASLEVHGDFTTILWRNPKSAFYWVRYTIHGNVLYVTGDLGEAVFRWYDKLVLSEFKDMRIGYFRQKCCASPYGRSFMTWDREHAEKALRYRYQEQLDYCDDEEGTEFDEKHKDKLESMVPHLGSKFEWQAFLSSESFPDGNKIADEIFGGDWWEYLYDVGMARTPEFEGIYYGLQMAIDQLENQNANA